MIFTTSILCIWCSTYQVHGQRFPSLKETSGSNSFSSVSICAAAVLTDGTLVATGQANCVIGSSWDILLGLCKPFQPAVVLEHCQKHKLVEDLVHQLQHAGDFDSVDSKTAFYFLFGHICEASTIQNML